MGTKKRNTKKGQERKRITPRFTSHQISAIDSLIGKLGADRSNVVSQIVVMWLYGEGHLNNINKNDYNK